MKNSLLKEISNIVPDVSFYFPRLFLLAFLSGVSLLTLAQTNTSLSGKVVEGRNRTPLEGATVHIKGTTHEVITDKAGEFRFITAQQLPVVYVVSFVGFQTAEVSVNVHTGAVIELKESNSQLNDVVVVGYGSQNRKSLIGSVSSVKASEITNKPAASFD